MAFQFELQVYTLSKIFNTNEGHWDYFVIRVPSQQRIKTAFKRDQHRGIQCIIEISDGTKLRLALDCLHIQAADRNTLLHCEGVFFLDATVSKVALQLWPGSGGVGGRGLCTGRGDANGRAWSRDVLRSHTHTHANKQTNKQTNTLRPLRQLLCSTIVLEIKADHWNRKDKEVQKQK